MADSSAFPFAPSDSPPESLAAVIVRSSPNVPASTRKRRRRRITWIAKGAFAGLGKKQNKKERRKEKKSGQQEATSALECSRSFFIGQDARDRGGGRKKKQVCV